MPRCPFCLPNTRTHLRMHTSPHTPPTHPPTPVPSYLRLAPLSFLATWTPSLLLLSLTLSLFPSSFLPDYISGDFDSITAEVKAFFSHKVSATQLNCAHTSAPPPHFQKDAQNRRKRGFFRQASFQKFELQNFTPLRDRSHTATIPFNADSPPRLLTF